MTDLRKAAEMALEALKDTHYRIIGAGLLDQDLLDRNFTVATALRQALAQGDEEELLKQGWRKCAVGQRTTQYCGMVEQARLEEREACAKVCETFYNHEAKDCAEAIRARGEK